jgi:tellurite methyltransferase
MEGQSDRARWDSKYAARQGPAHFEPNQLLIDYRHLLTGGRALDLACGFGGNALFLASLGYQVDAVDVSGVGLAQARAEARRRGLHLNLVQADLVRWWVPEACYDLIVVFFYLNRELALPLAQGLNRGGLLFQANRNLRYLNVRPGFSRDYLLRPGELRLLAIDAGLELLYNAENPPGQGHDSQIIARRPT